MNGIEKLKSFNLTKADAEKDIDLINQYSLKELKPEDVMCFSLVLCDNEVDRDCEKFTQESLEALAKMFVGKTGIKDHSWVMKNQVARLYRVELQKTGQKNSLGEPLVQLMGSAYMLRTPENESLINSIEGGIVKEVSVGFGIRKLTCSICGEQLKRSWWEPTKCKNDHVKGQTYDGATCIGLMEDPTDAYEFSFVAVPSQRGAGTTKAFETEASIFKMVMELSADELAENEEALDSVIKHLQSARQSADERKTRAEIAEKAKKYLTKGE
jgi:hypothetical protein